MLLILPLGLNSPTNSPVKIVRVHCSHWWQSHWFLGSPEAEVVAAAMSAGLEGERRTDTECLACHPRSASAGTRRSSKQTWWPPARGSAAGPGRVQTHGQQPGEGPCLQEYHSWLTWWSGVCLEPHLVSSSSPSSAPDCLFQVCALGADLFNFPTKRVWVELERLLSLTLASQPDTHPCGFRGSMTHRSQSGCRPGGVFLGRRREQGSHPGHQRGGCLRANTCRCKSQTRVQTALKQQWRKTTRNTFKTRRRPAARRT